jgi:hypothetical protein
MRNRFILGLLIGTCIAACVTKPATPPVSREVPLDASNIAEAQAAGYKIVNEKGKTLLCRKEPKTGSHVQFTTTCMTPEEWEQLAKDNRANVEGMSRRVQPPACSRSGGIAC